MSFTLRRQIFLHFSNVTCRSSIGIGFSSKNVPLSRLPGWEPESWAYHGDDGHSFCCQSSGKHYGPPFSAGDIIGCGVNFRTGAAFFTKNGDHLGLYRQCYRSIEFSIYKFGALTQYTGTAFREIKGKLFPSVGMKKSGEHIRVNFGQSPFVFDIDGMMAASNNSSTSSRSLLSFIEQIAGITAEEYLSRPTPLDPDIIRRWVSSEESNGGASGLAHMAAHGAANGAANGFPNRIAGHADRAASFRNFISQLQSRHREERSHIRTRTDHEIQREKRQIRQEIEATKYTTSFQFWGYVLTVCSTAKLAPPLSETELIQSLVCKIVHSGPLQANCDRSFNF